MAFSGFLIIDKPVGLTSRAALDRAAGWFPPGTRLGHCGTLDPLATGVLVVALGAATRLTDCVQHMAKVYQAGLRFGARSDTDDAEGTITATEGALPPSREAVERALAGFVGITDQVPPAYSAAKIDGRRAYKLARRGADVNLAPRQVRIDSIRLLDYVPPDLDIEVQCGKGTYIRALARDLGEQLGGGAYLRSLRRTCIGPFDVRAAMPLDADGEAARRAVLDLSWGLRDLPRVVVSQIDADRLVLGQALAWTDAGAPGEVAVFADDESLVGVGRIDEERRLRPWRIFRPRPAQVPASPSALPPASSKRG